MKSKWIAIAFVGAASLGLSGCVVNVGDEASDRLDGSHWAKVQDDNREKLTRLNLGMDREQVLALMGTADFSEAYLQDGKEMQVLFYRTQRNHGDGRTTKDECTPIILSNHSLVGWGEAAYAKL
ncbi:DUF3192 domain-containing protein [Shewanella salipaludis]|uniref:DUF3192 domain-containing protein n=1 Tax=Shewanella salipaludis TaxID=2723052 RepID=A0A972JIZ4_9GAMM|nr:DUF3192 domain-containing protein [Shewanella salipaludis]NMH64580.1 DUF3192 domain-containing protein [Shewanella salipaludis]